MNVEPRKGHQRLRKPVRDGVDEPCRFELPSIDYE